MRFYSKEFRQYTYEYLNGYVIPLNKIAINCPIAGLNRLNAYFKRLIAFAARVIDLRRLSILQLFNRSVAPQNLILIDR